MTHAHIMVVEDEGIVALDIQGKLQSMGYEVVTVVGTAEEAIRQAREQRPDLVLMDIQLEGKLDGVDAAERINSEQDIPIVYLTAFSDESTLQRAKTAQPSGYLLKPFEERDLYTTVEIALYKHEMETERARLEDRLRQSEKMEAIGQLTAGLAHNFNNMLQGVIGNLDLALMDADESLRPCLSDAIFDAERAARLLSQLMLFYRQGASNLATVDIMGVVEEVSDMCRSIFPSTMAISVDGAAGLPAVLGRREQLRQSIVNLCANARDALIDSDVGQKALIRISVSSDTHDTSSPHAPPEVTAGRFLRLAVTDNGCGMDRSVVDRMFEPFFTTKKEGSLTGLGLAVAYGIVRDHGGWLECDSTPGEGTTVAIYLPVAEDDAGDREEEEQAVLSDTYGTVTPTESLRGTETILVIADVDRFRKIVDAMLERNGYTVILGRDGRDGLSLYRHERETIDLVILGLSTPGISGQEVLAELLRLDPRVEVLVVTGHPRTRNVWAGASHVLIKPFNTVQLLQTVRNILER